MVLNRLPGLRRDHFLAQETGFTGLKNHGATCASPQPAAEIRIFRRGISAKTKGPLWGFLRRCGYLKELFCESRVRGNYNIKETIGDSLWLVVWVFDEPVG